MKKDPRFKRKIAIKKKRMMPFDAKEPALPTPKKRGRPAKKKTTKKGS